MGLLDLHTLQVPRAWGARQRASKSTREYYYVDDGRGEVTALEVERALTIRVQCQ